MYNIMPGDRVIAFDNTLFVNDKVTPLSVTMKPATVVCRYGKVSQFTGYKYPDLFDLKFDHRPNEISRAHLPHAIRTIL